MSQTTTRTSLPESRAWQKVLYRHVSWLTVESPGIKPNWSEESKLLVCKWLYKDKTLRRDIASDICFFIGTGTTRLCKESLKREQNGEASWCESSLRIRLLSPVGPEAIPTGNTSSTDSTSCGVKTFAGISRIRRKRRPWSDCVDAQSDQGPRCLLTALSAYLLHRPFYCIVCLLHSLLAAQVVYSLVRFFCTACWLHCPLMCSLVTAQPAYCTVSLLHTFLLDSMFIAQSAYCMRAYCIVYLLNSPPIVRIST